MHMHDREQEKDKLITAGFLIIILCTYLQSACNCNGQDVWMDPIILKSKYNKTFGMKDRQRAETVNTVSGSDFMIAIS